MKIVKYVGLNILLLLALWLCGTVVIWLFGLLPSLHFDNVGVTGAKVGILAYLIILGAQLYRSMNKKKEMENGEE